MENYQRRLKSLSYQPPNKPNLHLDTDFVKVLADFDSDVDGILSVRRGDILRVQRDGKVNQKWWIGTIIKSYHHNRGTGYFFTDLTEPYDFIDNRIATRVPKLLIDLKNNSRL